MGISNLIRSVVALAVVALLGGTLLAAAPVTAAQAPRTHAPAAERATESERLASCAWQRRRCFAAISLNTRTGVTGTANDKRSRARAVSTAHRSCQARSADQGGFPGQCKRAGWVRNGCLAVAIRVRNNEIVEWGSGYAYNPPPAQRKARSKVQGPGRILIQQWVCTTRTR